MLRRKKQPAKQTISHFKRITLYVSAALLVAAPLVSLFNVDNQNANAAPTGLNTSIDINQWARSIKYYYMLDWCLQNDAFKPDINGSDIDNGPWTWMTSQDVSIGRYFDNWGDKNGKTSCFGENSNRTPNDQPSDGWFADAMNTFGVSFTSTDGGDGKLELLQKFGYTCKRDNTGTNFCHNDNANQPKTGTAITSTVLKYINSLPYFKDTGITSPDNFVSSDLYQAANYYVAKQGFTKYCSAVQGGNTQGGTMAMVDDITGAITKNFWSYNVNGSLSQDGVLDLGMGDPAGIEASYHDKSGNLYRDTGADQCWQLALKWLTPDFGMAPAVAYQKWIYRVECLGGTLNFTNNADLGVCVSAIQNKDQAGYCLTTYPPVSPNNMGEKGTSGWTSGADSNSHNRNVCFQSQLMPQKGGQYVGQLCLLQYPDNLNLQIICTYGALNTTNAGYCSSQYHTTSQDDPSYKACVNGQTIGNGAATNDAYAKLAPPDKCSNNLTDPSCQQPTTSCAVDGIGWIVCPILTGLSKISDGMFGFLAGQFLQTNTDVVSTSSPTYTAWSLVRNIANVVFVIVFIIIIFSQITGYGITNYGVKKMLPRLIVAAILVNISYYIVQLAVDLSNILGYSIKSLLDGISGNLNAQSGYYETGINGSSSFLTRLTSNVLAGAAIAGGTALIWFNLAALVPILIAGMVAILMIFMMLILREMLIVLMVVLSPLAFVAFILPNTSSLFTKWRKTFTALLLVFPIVSLIYGASSLASMILKTAYQGSAGALQQVVAAAVLTLPLFIVPVFLKKSLDGVNGIGNFMNKMGKGLGGMAGKGASKVYGNTALARGQRARSAARQNYRDEKYARAVSGQSNSLMSRARRGVAMGPPAITNAQKYAKSRVGATASSAAVNADAEEVKAAQSVMQTMGFDELQTSFEGAVKSGDHVKARAAQNLLLASAPGRDKFHESLRKDDIASQLRTDAHMNSQLRDNVAVNHKDMKGKDNAVAMWGYDKNNGELSAHQASASTYAGLTDAEMAGQSRANLLAAMSTGALTSDMANRILSNPQLSQNLGDRRSIFEQTAASGGGQTPTGSGQVPTPSSGSGSATPTAAEGDPVLDIPHADTAPTAQPTPEMPPAWQEWHKQEAERQARQAATPSTAGSHVDEQGRQTPNTASADYHQHTQE